MRAENKTAALYAEIWARINIAKASGDPDTYGFLTRLQSVLWQYEAVTPRTTDYLPCQACDTYGHVEQWNAAVGQAIRVSCHWCQGSGRTWNPHPKVGELRLRGEM